jgi:hypothetical protein
MKNRLVRSIFVLILLAPAAAWSQVSINIAPPPLPLYAQPLVPGEGYIWTPGYWSWNPADDDYYWVPGTWVLAPNPGQLWTPGYWAFEGAGYFWHAGYWGTQVGYYGGLNYGYGYTGTGYQGGRWDGRVFRYNAAASHVDPKVVHNVYNSRVANGAQTARVSFSRSPASASARTAAASARTPAAAQRQPTVAATAGPTAEQVQHEHTALTTPTQRAWVPHGPPQVAATPRPSAFTVPEVEHVRSQPAARAPQAAQPRPQARAQPQAQRPAQAAPERPAAKAEGPRKEH